MHVYLSRFLLNPWKINIVLLHLRQTETSLWPSPPGASFTTPVRTCPEALQLPLNPFFFALSTGQILEWSYCSFSQTRQHLSHRGCTSPLSPCRSVEPIFWRITATQSHLQNLMLKRVSGTASTMLSTRRKTVWIQLVCMSVPEITPISLHQKNKK